MSEEKNTTKIFGDVRFAFRHNPQSWWEENNPTLLAGEHGVVTDSTIPHQREKIGDGIKTWNELGWWHGPRGEQGPLAPTDQTYNPSSVYPQSGAAVAQAIAQAGHIKHLTFPSTGNYNDVIPFLGDLESGIYTIDGALGLTNKVINGHANDTNSISFNAQQIVYVQNVDGVFPGHCTVFVIKLKALDDLTAEVVATKYCLYQDQYTSEWAYTKNSINLEEIVTTELLDSTITDDASAEHIPSTEAVKNFVDGAVAPQCAELIETITITESGINEITRTKEPDGTPYNFKSMAIMTVINPCTVQNLVIHKIYEDVDASISDSNAGYQASCTVTTSGRFVTSWFEVVAGMWLALGTGSTIQGSPTTAQTWRHLSVYGGPIKKIAVIGNKTAFEVGTTINIYGVRA